MIIIRDVKVLTFYLSPIHRVEIESHKSYEFWGPLEILVNFPLEQLSLGTLI